ncbi:MAG: TraR/DksA C4-type zinc finger protein [Patescibacteria group bacterium]
MAAPLKTSNLFSVEFLKEMEEKLLELREELQQKIKKMEARNTGDAKKPDAEYPEYGDEEEDNVHEIEELVVNQNVKIEYDKELRDVEEALERMKKGTYGICKYTGEKIPEERLRIRPTSSASVAAKSAFKP